MAQEVVSTARPLPRFVGLPTSKSFGASAGPGPSAPLKAICHDYFSGAGQEGFRPAGDDDGPNHSRRLRLRAS